MSAAWLWLALSVAGSSGGNTLMKVASDQGRRGLARFVSLPFILGGIFFACGLAAYTRALTFVPLAVAYPTVVGGSLLVITAVAMWRFKERIGAWHVVGVALIFCGLVVLTLHAQPEVVEI